MSPITACLLIWPLLLACCARAQETSSTPAAPAPTNDDDEEKTWTNEMIIIIVVIIACVIACIIGCVVCFVSWRRTRRREMAEAGQLEKGKGPELGEDVLTVAAILEARKQAAKDSADVRSKVG